MEVQVSCDPSAETCFKHVCDPEQGTCSSDSGENTSYYKVIQSKGFLMPQCVPGSADCLEPNCLGDDGDCRVVFCSDSDAQSRGDVCNVPEDYNPEITKEEGANIVQ